MLSHCSQSSDFKRRIDVRLEQLLPARWKPELEFMHYLATNNSITAGRTNRPKRRPLLGKCEDRTGQGFHLSAPNPTSAGTSEWRYAPVALHVSPNGLTPLISYDWL